MFSLNSAIGNTPLIELKNLTGISNIRIYAKLEFLNPGGSVKDRMVSYILNEYEKSGKLQRGGVIVENTSGNTGAALAMLAVPKGYRVILTMPDKVSREKQETLKALGAEVIVCPTSASPGSPEHYVQKARDIASTTDNAVMLNQYDNRLNVEAHYNSTGPEIWNTLRGNIDYFVAAGSTGGTISGVGKFLKEMDPKIKVVMPDPIGSIYYEYFNTGTYSQESISTYQVEGIGEDHIAKCMDFSIVDSMMQFTDDMAFSATRLLARKEGIFAGGSSGANIWGCLELMNSLEHPANIVTILPDSGVKYLSKIFS
ncbi:PLP-dependent cysteine synthase family protein [Maridesulfovibrio zosterae]|uniref:PLP-dependent cysteine synthase family protein n=1 Tax=Maridesulfovibrio zosterae TaxID=82171 RepID=UPI0003F4CCFE|nr:cysteine synthase family protein [Maridesulfovibrio zosterae]